MFSLLNFLLGLLSGILATLIAGNPQIRFQCEKFVRKVLKKPLVNATLRTFRIFAKMDLYSSIVSQLRIICG